MPLRGKRPKSRAGVVESRPATCAQRDPAPGGLGGDEREHPLEAVAGARELRPDVGAGDLRERRVVGADRVHVAVREQLPEPLDRLGAAAGRVPLEPRVRRHVLEREAEVVRAGLDPDVGAACPGVADVGHGLGGGHVRDHGAAAGHFGDERDALDGLELRVPRPRLVPRRRVAATLRLEAPRLEVDDLGVLAVHDHRQALLPGSAHAVEHLAGVGPGVHARRRDAAGEELQRDDACLGQRRDILRVVARSAAEQRVVDEALGAHVGELLLQPRAERMGGLSSGMSTTVVMPPFAAARVAPR